MSYRLTDMINLLSVGSMQQIFASDALNISQYVTLTAFLIRNGIPFDTEYTPSNGRDSTELVVTVYVNPKVSVDFSFSDLNLTDVP